MSAAWELDLPDGWSYKSLIDLVSDIVDNRGRSAPTSSSGIPLIATNCITHDSLYPVFKNVRYVSQDTYQTWFRAHPRPGDIIFVNKGTPGLVCQVPEPVDFCFAQDMVALRPDSEVVDGEFLLAALRSVFVAEQVRAFSVGTTIPHLKKSDFSQLLIPVPPRHVQEYIGHIYCNLSRKIEVNRRINRKLERMAQALYKHWFVDFGPFQDGEFVESELGLVPKGWEVTTVGDVCRVVNGATPSTKVATYWDCGDICWATPTDMTALTAPVIFDTSKKITQLGLDNCSATLLPVGSVLVTSRATIGISAINYTPMATNQGFKSLICGPRASNHFMLLHMKSHVDEMISRANGTTFLEINSTNFKAMELVLPPQEVVTAFDRQVKPYFDQIHANQRENVSLARTRDYLLPRLLSGEVEV